MNTSVRSTTNELPWTVHKESSVSTIEVTVSESREVVIAITMGSKRSESVRVPGMPIPL
jgi:hypothetical protein